MVFQCDKCGASEGRLRRAGGIPLVTLPVRRDHAGDRTGFLRIGVGVGVGALLRRGLVGQLGEWEDGGVIGVCSRRERVDVVVRRGQRPRGRHGGVLRRGALHPLDDRESSAGACLGAAWSQHGASGGFGGGYSVFGPLVRGS